MDTRKVGEEDFISKLPNGVVGHILSYLNIKEAFQTAVLFRRWRIEIRFLWTLWTEFFAFVDPEIFRHSLWDFLVPSRRVNEWISYAQRCNVKELGLFLFLENDERIRVRLPENFSSCASLVALTLGNDFVFTIPSTITCFPSLKVLRVGAAYPDCEFLSTLFCRCPVLEDLLIRVILYQDGDDQVKHTFTISIPTLKRLKIDISRRFEIFWDQKFIIQTPNLEYLTILDDFMTYFVVDEIPSLLEAKVSIVDFTFFYKDKLSQQEVHRVMMGILKGIRNTKFLNLKASTTAVS
ncbi:probable FBD-associated F-box protein At1g32375 [Durio zibethinus]|uniref:Probable FBD-associated F-box protein At1g32375 n=1 Tax=Durio zibethinus TaxID=66656 RepID=A0A6P5Y0W7_DURZI|nr:probable FBD-associated F-box protein At1g32375 [Durio zibethinus]